MPLRGVAGPPSRHKEERGQGLASTLTPPSPPTSVSPFPESEAAQKVITELIPQDREPATANQESRHSAKHSVSGGKMDEAEWRCEEHRLAWREGAGWFSGDNDA